MLVALVPLFDKEMSVCAYSIFTQKKNLFENPNLGATGMNDGASRIEGLELINEVGIDTMCQNKDVFVSVNNIAIFSDIMEQCSAPLDRVVLMFDKRLPAQEMYVERLKELKGQGFRMAIRALPVSEYEQYRSVLELMDYIFINSHKVELQKAKIYFSKLYPNLKLCAGNIDTVERYEEIAQSDYDLYEGNFYRMAATKNQNEVEPLKVNYIELLNKVNNDNFELTEVADIVSRDTALTISLLKMVNRMTVRTEITSIRHAAAMMGQKELRKWINTAVANQLYADKANEITRISLLRAKFAENLASTFGLAIKADELFLLGLFSVLDIILEKSMAVALQIVKVSAKIEEALVEEKGDYFPVIEFVKNYEDANWQEVSRQILLHNMDMEVVNNAYRNSMVWYSEIMRED